MPIVVHLNSLGYVFPLKLILRKEDKCSVQWSILRLLNSATHSSLAWSPLPEERTLLVCELFRGGSLMSLVADTVCMYLSFVCTICFSPYRLLFRVIFFPASVPLHKSMVFSIKGTELIS